MNKIPNIIFIVPYRNRKNYKILFKNHMKYILQDIPSSEYEIYYSHQCDDRPFNRGAVKNIGFLAMRDKYPDHYKNITFVFNDVDTIPYEKNLLNYNTTDNIVKHYYGFEFALGGIFSIKGKDFERCNGFPNYWGYGYEDNVIQLRIKKLNMKIDRSNFYKLKNDNILQLNDIKTRILTNEQPNVNIEDNINNDLNSIYNLNYHIDQENEENMINIKNFDIKNYSFENNYYYSLNMQQNNGKIPKNRIEHLKNLNAFKSRFKMQF